MAINRELSQFGRLVEIIDGEHIGIGTTSNVSIGFGTITADKINNLTFPTSLGNVGDVLRTDGAGNLLFESLVVGAASTWRVTEVGIHTTKSVGIGTEARSEHALTVLGTGSTALFVEGNARITGILSIGTGTVTIDGDNSTITATNFIGELTSNFPSGDYGDFTGGTGVDAFGQVVIDASLYDLLDTPSNTLRTEDLGVLT